MNFFAQNPDLYPTPEKVLDIAMKDEIITGKIIYDPSCGTGNILEYCTNHGASQVIGTEIDDKVRVICKDKGKMLGSDFLKIKAEDISHVDMIVMNPPFSADENHILHAIEIAPANCRIIALCNWNTIAPKLAKGGKDTQKQVQLKERIKHYNGKTENLEDCFSYAERKTYAEIGLIKLTKSGQDEMEFEGFFMEEEPEYIQSSGIVKHNFVADIVNRYVTAVKKFEQIVQFNSEMNSLIGSFFKGRFGFDCKHYSGSKIETTVDREVFKTELQKQAWVYVFEKLNMDEYVTRKLKSDLNSFVEKQKKYPFTMKNVYKMIEIVLLTHESRMDTALLEVVDKLTKHHKENRFGVEGWATNEHHMLGKKFIIDYMCPQDKWNKGREKIDNAYGSSFDFIEDLNKALCYFTKTDHKQIGYLSWAMSDGLYGQKIHWGFFTVVAYKKGTCHFEFKDLDVWATVNQHVARILGFPLPESVKRSKFKEREHAKTQKQYEGEAVSFKKKKDYSEPSYSSPVEEPKVEQKTDSTIQTSPIKPEDEEMKIKMDMQEAIDAFENEGKQLAEKEDNKSFGLEPIPDENKIFVAAVEKSVLDQIKQDDKENQQTVSFADMQLDLTF